MKSLIVVIVLAMSGVVFAQAKTSPGAGPSVVVVETEKGTFEFETYPNEAPKTVAHIVELINKKFYNGQRVHRVVPGFVMQFGDQQTRDEVGLDGRRPQHAGRDGDGGSNEQARPGGHLAEESVSLELHEGPAAARRRRGGAMG